MMKKTVDSIRKTEKEAQKIIEDATLQVAQKRDEAVALAKKKQEETIAQVKAQAEQAMIDAKAKGESILDVAQKDAVNEANALRAKAKKNESAAIQLVIEHLI